MTSGLATNDTTARPPILSRALLVRFVSLVGASIGFHLALAVVPMYADAAGSKSAGGLANGALLVATVIGELATPRLVGRIGYRWALAGGLFLLGAPLLVLVSSASFPVIFAVNAIRGVGFAVTIVAGGALTAALIPQERRGEGLGIVGLVVGIPALVALPFGTWAAGHWGFDLVFVVAAAAPLAALAPVAALPNRVETAGEQHGVLSGLRNRGLRRPAVIFAMSASAAGVVVTYLPLAVGDAAGWVAPTALFFQPAASTVGRWVAGRLGDSRGQTRQFVPGILLAVSGMAAMAFTSSAALVVGGAATFGAGFGVLQNTSLSLMFARVTASGYDTVSAIWNAGFDLGMAAGAIGVGLLVNVIGFGPAFMISAATMLPTLFMARRETLSQADRTRVEVATI